MTVLSLKDVSLAYGAQAILDHVDLDIGAGERICLVGRNGSGKSTLLRVLAGERLPDDGEVWRREPLTVSHLEQDVPPDDPRTVYDVVASGLEETGRLLTAYRALAAQLGTGADAGRMGRLAELQQKIEALDGWAADNRIAATLSRLSLSGDRPLAECSGGLRRRALLARALVSEPDLLLLDEPTNHMDIAAIDWLEQYLLGLSGALVFITHDRSLARRISTRIIELDRGRLTSWPGDYDTFLRRRDEALAAEARAQARFDRRLAEEEAWLRQGVRARRARNEGRVQRLLAMRQERAERRERGGRANFGVDAGELSGRRVVDLRDVSFRYGEAWVVRHLTTTIMRGDRIGILGPNGSGKSTLLRLILGELEPTSGTVVQGSRLDLAYFDQHREQLDPRKTVRENIAGGTDHVTIRGRSRHVAGYLKDFLFPPARLDTPAGVLSGGERNRLLLARLFTQPANLMVLDEPTNDLDVETLELLEDLLADYDGTLLLVSHDRTFLDNVVTSMLVFEGGGRVGEYVGGYEDWLRQRPAPPPKTAPEPEAPRASQRRRPAPEADRRLSYRERQELEALPPRIEQLEAELAGLEAAAARPDFYTRDSAEISADVAAMEKLRAVIETAWARWEALTERDEAP